MKMHIGEAGPLGATCHENGTNFAVLAGLAERVELALFDEAGQETRFELPGRTGSCHHGYLEGARPGLRYGYRARGAWAPRKGGLCFPHKLLLDPCARAVDGTVRWNRTLFPLKPKYPAASPNHSDTAPFMPKGIIIDPSFDWENDERPNIPSSDMVIYETHVKGFTARHPALPKQLKGSYAGFAHEAVIEHLHNLGITTVELLPVFQFAHRQSLRQKRLSNYWGYDPIGFFAPHNEYASDGSGETAVREFKGMVKALHKANIELILDVVYNHTPEANAAGPILSLKGLDNPAYYLLDPEDPLHYFNYSGTGNTLNTQNPQVQEMILQSLRYWTDEMHVDGFRFDLAPLLMRVGDQIDPGASLMRRIQEDPVLSARKLIAEPWDLGPDGYSLGRFPTGWSEWNGQFRDVVRDYWRGDCAAQHLATRMQGSPDLFNQNQRKPTASINLVTCHDGFTLHDLVTYEKKHNRANGEKNRDGEMHNHAWNCGHEGETKDASIRELRSQQKRNLLATLLLANGVPMLLGGDELGRTQAGNNNAYCQDNTTSWYDWSAADPSLQPFLARLIGLRRSNPLFAHDQWPDEQRIHWFTPHEDHLPTSDAEAHASSTPVGALFEEEENHRQKKWLLLLNPTPDQVTFRPPLPDGISGWMRQIDTTRHDGTSKARIDSTVNEFTLPPHALHLYMEER
jgi:isoamylase